MLKDIPLKYKDFVREHQLGEAGNWKKVQDYIHMLQLFNYILNHAPSFNESGMVRYASQCYLELVDGNQEWKYGVPEPEGELDVEEGVG